MALRSFVLIVLATLMVLPMRPATAAEHQDSIYKQLKFRNLGPVVAGGRVTSVAGIPGHPDTFYVGAAAGGVWKTVNGGTSWKAVFKHESTATIGAIAIAPSNPDVVWVGTGEGNIRNDITDGDGVYLSTDAGHSWRHVGLANAGQISRIVVDPHDPNTAFVAAIGHAWTPNKTRGVFKTTDGGKSWHKVLYIDDSTGAADLVMQPGNGEVLYAAMWHVRRLPWTLIDGGKTSGIYRSLDGGETWKKLEKGLPTGDIGRIALAIAPSKPARLYALIGAKHGMLWRSDDRGDSWNAINDSHTLDVRPFYFSKIEVAPDNPDRVYFLAFRMQRSDDGGKTFKPADRGVHVDHHTLWIDPTDPSILVQGNDGGVFISRDAGAHWRFLDNLPIEQFYQVALSSAQPYTVCGGLQDNSGWCGPSSNYGRDGVTGQDWYVAAGGDGEYVVPAPSDPNIVYADSQDGFMTRQDLTTKVTRLIRPTLEDVGETKPADLKYRFNWTAPIAVSETDANDVYIGANVVFHSTDGGEHWQVISPDLTRNDKSKQIVAGGPVQHDISSAENYDTILSITIAHTDPKVLWAGTDDGRVQVTRDGGKNWTEVGHNMRGAPDWGRIYQIGVSPFAAGTAYVAVDAHMWGNRQVYVYRTDNYGRSWRSIDDGLPKNTPARVVREDPNQKGFLALGTDTGMYYSRDAGEHWHRLDEFPTAPVWDLKFDKRTRDLVVATHGRGVFVLDNIRPLEQFSAATRKQSFHLFSAGPAVQWYRWSEDEGQPTGYKAANAPYGAAIDYYLKTALADAGKAKGKGDKSAAKDAGAGKVSIVVTDAAGARVAKFHGPAKAGINRAVWNTRYQSAEELDFIKHPGKDKDHVNGPRVLPGTYTVTVTAAGASQKATVDVVPDPNAGLAPAELSAQLAAALKGRDTLTALDQALNRLHLVHSQLTTFQQHVRGDDGLKAKYGALAERAGTLAGQVQKLIDKALDPTIQHDVIEDELHQLADLHGKVEGAAGIFNWFPGQAPTAEQLSRLHQLEGETAAYVKAVNSLLEGPVASYNDAAHAAGAGSVFSGQPITLKAAAM